MENALSINNLTYNYGKGRFSVKALQAVSLQVKKGEIFGFIGPNGAGKTTTIKHILGIIPCPGPDISIFGISPSLTSARKRIGYMPETAIYYGYLTPLELLMMYGDICLVERAVLKKRALELIDAVGLSGHIKKTLSTFSKGMMQKVSFAQALINDPDLLVLDEPTSGLDPLARKKMRQEILRFKDMGKTVFFSSHELSEVELIADRIGVIDHGVMKVSGTVEELLKQKDTGQTLESYFLDMIGEGQ